MQRFLYFSHCISFGFIAHAWQASAGPQPFGLYLFFTFIFFLLPLLLRASVARLRVWRAKHAHTYSITRQQHQLKQQHQLQQQQQQQQRLKRCIDNKPTPLRAPIKRKNEKKNIRAGHVQLEKFSHTRQKIVTASAHTLGTPSSPSPLRSLCRAHFLPAFPLYCLYS